MEGVLTYSECLQLQLRHVHSHHILETRVSDDDGFQLAIIVHIEGGNVVVVATIVPHREMGHILWDTGVIVSIVYSVGYRSCVCFTGWMVVIRCLRRSFRRLLNSHRNSQRIVIQLTEHVPSLLNPHFHFHLLPATPIILLASDSGVGVNQPSHSMSLVESSGLIVQVSPNIDRSSIHERVHILLAAILVFDHPSRRLELLENVKQFILLEDSVVQHDTRLLVVVETASLATDAVLAIFAPINDHVVFRVANDEKESIGSILQHGQFLSREREPVHTLRHHSVMEQFHASFPLAGHADPGELDNALVEELDGSVELSVFRLGDEIFVAVVALEVGDLDLAVAAFLGLLASRHVALEEAALFQRVGDGGFFRHESDNESVWNWVGSVGFGPNKQKRIGSVCSSSPARFG